MDLTADFWASSVFWRIAVGVFGAFCVMLGHRLYRRGMRRSGEIDVVAVRWEGKSVSAMKLKHAAPGVAVAMLGCLIVAVMALSFGPMRAVPGMPGLAMTVASGPEIGPLRRPVLATAPNPGLTFQSLMDLGREQDRLGETGDAMDYYGSALSVPGISSTEAAAAIDRLATLHRRQGMTVQALTLARLSVKMAPKNASYFHTLALALEANGEVEGARAALEHAAELDPRYAPDLGRLLKRLQ